MEQSINNLRQEVESEWRQPQYNIQYNNQQSLNQQQLQQFQQHHKSNYKQEKDINDVSKNLGKYLNGASKKRFSYAYVTFAFGGFLVAKFTNQNAILGAVLGLLAGIIINKIKIKDD